MSTLAERLKQAIAREPGRSQAALARAVGVSTASVSDWFNGVTKTLKAESLRKAAAYLGCNRDWLATGFGDPGWIDEQRTSEGVEGSTVAHAMSHRISYAGRPTTSERVLVTGTLVMSPPGVYRLEVAPDGAAIGHVEAYSNDGRSFALRIHGDALYPTIRHGACLVVEPMGRCVEGELVLVISDTETYAVVELVAERADSVTVLPANGGKRETIDRKNVKSMYPIANIVPGSKWRPA